MNPFYIYSRTKKYLWAIAVGIILAVVISIVLFLPEKGEQVISPGANTGTSIDSDVVYEYDYTEAPNHIGERAKVKGKVIRVFTSKSGVTFFDFCQNFDSCPFSAVIFASDLDKFSDLTQYERAVSISGVIKAYQGKAEIILNSPEQIE
jgi:hypothetical protein